MRARGLFPGAAVALRLLLLVCARESHQQNALVVREKCSSADEKLTLPWITLSSVSSSGYDACLRLCLRIKPLSVNKTLRIEFNQLAIRNVVTLSIWRGRRSNTTVRWELKYDCFMAEAGCTVHVAVFDANRTLITDSYTVNPSPEEDAVPVYNMKFDIFSKRFIVGMEAGQKVYVRLCYENKPVCKEIVSNKIDTDLNRTVVLNFPYLVPCVCMQTYYDEVDAKRDTTCPLKDKILPGGGEVLFSSSLQDIGSSVLEWKPICPSTQFKPVVSLCWQHTQNHSQCVPVHNSTLHESALRYNVSDVDRHAHMCLKFVLNESHHVFCPFSSGVLSEWDVTVTPGAQRLYVRLSSSIPGSFAAQLCVEKDGACVVKENVHTVQLEEGGRGVELTVPLPFFTVGLCVQVWRSEPALRGRRIICPDYTHRRWGLIVAALLAVLVAITTVGILIYNLIKRQTSVWRSAERKPVLLVCSSDEKSHISAMCALAHGLQEELRMDVRLAQWTHCSTQSSLAQLGPAPWLYGQCQQVHSVGGMVLIAWSAKAQHSFLRWRERENAEKVKKNKKKDKVQMDQHSQAKSQSSITAPVFNAALISLWAGLRSGRHGQGFGLVCFRGLSGTRYIPKELRGIRRYCLPRDLSNLIHELDVNGPRNGVETRSSWCCWPRLFSKGLSFWLSQRLAQRLDAWLPQTAAGPARKSLLRPSHKVASEKPLNKRLRREKYQRENLHHHAVDCKLATQKKLLA
ncbi:interleukin-17 receptor E isoform X2 [Clarias gariepinus]|uniref:interleukin-17 receptor E isoform X2 n=1 Tax=Clarias gariepinus TaxID=13013 RepID=UPI00234C9917|nr:interleukin-17 receptor E isoform X2 [Clarias gariepinus]